MRSNIAPKDWLTSEDHGQMVILSIPFGFTVCKIVAKNRQFKFMKISDKMQNDLIAIIIQIEIAERLD